MKNYNLKTKKYRIINKYSNSKNFYYIRAAAKNINCPTHILKKIFYSKNSNWLIKSYVVKNRNCTIDLLREISETKDWFVAASIPHNKNCTEDLIINLLNNSIESNKPHLISTMLNKLENHVLTTNLLKKMFKECNFSFIKEMIVGHPNWKLSDFE